MKHEWETKNAYLKQCKHCKGCQIKHPITGDVRYLTIDSKELPVECKGSFPQYGKGPDRPTIPPPAPEPFACEAKAQVFRRAWIASSEQQPVKLIVKTGGELIVPEEWTTDAVVALQCWVNHNPMSATDDALYVGLGHRGLIYDCAIPWSQVIGILFDGTAVMFGREQEPSASPAPPPEPKPEPKPEPEPRSNVIDLASRRNRGPDGAA